MSYEPIGLNLWPSDLPGKDQFNGRDIEVTSARIEFHLRNTDHGDNLSKDTYVPDGRVLVGWHGEETSCDRCSDEGYNIIMVRSGTRTFPIGINVGARLEPGGQGGAGAHFTFDVTLLSVPYSVWVKASFISELKSYKFELV